MLYLPKVPKQSLFNLLEMNLHFMNVKNVVLIFYINCLVIFIIRYADKTLVVLLRIPIYSFGCNFLGSKLFFKL